MQFEAKNLKDTFKTWKYCLIILLIGITLFCGIFLFVEIPNYIEMTYDPYIFGAGYFHTAESYDLIHKIVSVAVLLPIIDISLIIFIRLFKKWEKDAQKYGLGINATEIEILCEGNSVLCEIKDVKDFEIAPKNFEPHNFKSKWTETAIITTADKEYKLYYLGNIKFIKEYFEKAKSQII